MLDASVVTAVQNYLQALQQHGVAVQFGVVFGSQVMGSPDAWSDIDLLVVSPKFDAPYDRRLIDLLWRVCVQVDSRIEPIPCGVLQWETDDASAIVEIARRHGARVALSDGDTPEKGRAEVGHLD